ncbi:peptidase C39 family protein [Paenibacillus albiflavus]|uniref:Peptidase C39 family protein n=1 Tax=Paenibacillus albiflavus TaxID=2545760 RepID=A0A4R4EIR0_9BACL|nr:C39 family peptidase [Paenibacillus albiflavus]TCZ80054.1 peptidase C39 family protein [Paenibacillus albiflavus]
MINFFKRKIVYVIIAVVIAFILFFKSNPSNYSESPPLAAPPAPAEPQTVTPISNVEHTDAGGSIITDVPLIKQKPELPRGCEVTSLTMLLQYAGVQVDKMELANNIHKVPFERHGLRGDLNEGFVGDMYSFSNPGLGVYIPPLMDLGNQYLPDQMINLTGSPMEELYHQIDQGRPVLIIINALFRPLDEDQFQYWDTENGQIRVTYQEHSVLIVGYDDNYVYINDPLVRYTKLDRYNFEQAWKQMGSQALTIDL